ncbi:MAG: nucleotidyltransferase domain-containing protein [Nanoarchaeota archaeon]
METSKFNFTKLQNQIFRLMCLFAGRRLNLSEIAKNLKVSVSAVSKAVPLIEKLGLIKIEKDKKMNLTKVFFNRDNYKAMQLKRVENLKQIYESNLADFLEDEFKGGTAILFGSYSRGDDTFESDVDIAVVGIKNKSLNLEKFETILKRKININFYSSFKKIHAHLKNNLLNGIILSGSVEL